jgi:hypothetical protein
LLLREAHASAAAAACAAAAAAAAAAEVPGVRGSGVENSAKKDKSGQSDIHNLDTKKIQLYSFLEAETAAYVSSICFLKFPRSNRCRL